MSFYFECFLESKLNDETSLMCGIEIKLRASGQKQVVRKVDFFCSDLICFKN